MREVEVLGVRVEMPSNQPIVLLRESAGDRYVPIWIGAVEATAIAFAREGHNVALVCSGDPAIYAMASPTLEQGTDGIEVEIVPGVTASLAASAILGAPLGHDHATISLSDLLTPWEVIEKRIVAAAQADFVICFYNPRSRGQIGRAHV